MTTDDFDWKTRYYELEHTLEQMLTAFQKVLAAHDYGTEDRSPISIRRISFISAGQATLLCCVADGTNLEYSFDFFTGDEAVTSVPFGPVNAAEIPLEIHSGNLRCVIKVRSLEDEDRPVIAQEVQI